jgi:hypothetical protein
MIDKLELEFNGKVGANGSGRRHLANLNTWHNRGAV